MQSHIITCSQAANTRLKTSNSECKYFTLEAYVSCPLIPLYKNAGIRPVGVGKFLQRIIGKCIGWVLKKDIQLAAGPLQMATGLQAGAKAAIHSMQCMF